MTHINSLPWLKFAHEDYLFSEFRAAACALAKAAYFDLLCFAMKQTPALSLPNNDRILAGWIGLSLKRWQRIKHLVLAQFTLNPEDDRYYSPMLSRLYNEPAADTQPRAMTGAERVRKHRAARRNAAVTGDTVTCNDEVTTEPVSGNAEVTASNAATVTYEEIKREDSESESDSLKTSTTARAHVAEKPRDSFALHFGWQPRQSALDQLLASLQIDPARHTARNLARCVAHYQARAITHSQAEWEVVYANWLGRERTPEAAAQPKEHRKASAAPPPPVRLADERPQWQIFAERQAARENARH